MCVREIFLPDGGGGEVSPYSHSVLTLSDLLGPVWVQPGYAGHVAGIHHGHDPVLYTQLTGEEIHAAVSGA